jgi:hypothetical protein
VGRPEHKESVVEVRIGVQNAPREIVLDSEQSADEVTALVETAISAGSSLRLIDSKGRTVVVPGDRLAYVELDPTSERKVGFASF